jgi:hypothetical protein
MTNKTFAIGAAAFGAVALLSASAFAYCLNGVRWYPGSPDSEDVFYNSAKKVTSGQCISSTAMDNEVTGGITVWNVLNYAGTTTKTPNKKDGTNVVGWAKLGGTTLGITNYLDYDRFRTKTASCSGSTLWSELYEVDVRLSTSYRWYDGTGACPCAAGSAMDLGGVSEHEFGHVIGLCHENDFATLMNSSVGACSHVAKGSDETAGENAICY